MIEFTTVSQNGQVVIPSATRKQAGITPKTQFAVLARGKNILLRRINEEEWWSEAEIKTILAEADENIRKGNVFEQSEPMNFKEWNKAMKQDAHSLPPKVQKSARKNTRA